MPPSDPTPDPPSSRRLVSAIELVGWTLLLWLAAMNLPGPPVLGLDSWHTILVDAHIQGREFGREIAFTYGPWSFLSLSGYLPEALGVRFVWEIAGKLALAGTIVTLAGAFPPVRRRIFLAGFSLGLPFFDNAAQVLIALLALIWLIPATARRWQLGVAVGWLALLAHFKFVFCLQALACVILASLAHMLEKRWRRAASLPALFAAGYVILWLAAGQPLGNLPSFWRLSWEISTGYSWAMGWEPAAVTLAAAVPVAICGLGLTGSIWRAPAGTGWRLAAILLAVANGLLAWKQGFTRADDHVFAFFYFCLYFGWATIALYPPPRDFRWVELNPAFCIAGILTLGWTSLLQAPSLAVRHWRNYPRQLLHLDAWTARFDQALRATADSIHDPYLAESVGEGTVDLINFDQGLIFYHGLDYRPRPVIQSYSAYTPALLEANRRYFAGPEAPDYVVLVPSAIDGRYPGQEDALALAEIARRYELAGSRPGYLLLRRRPDADIVAGIVHPLGEYSPDFGEPVPLPEASGAATWVEIDLRPTPLGRLRSFFYHASAPRLVARHADGAESVFRLIPSTSGVGFFVSPFLVGMDGFADLMTGERRSSAPQSIAVRLEHSWERWLWEPPQVRFFDGAR